MDGPTMANMMLTCSRLKLTDMPLLTLPLGRYVKRKKKYLTSAFSVQKDQVPSSRVRILGFLPLEDGTDRLPRNFAKVLPQLAV
jgi:hypothetical protein